MFRLAQALAREAELWLYACAGTHELENLRKSPELSLYREVRARNNDVLRMPSATLPQRVRHHCPRGLARALRRDHARTPFDALLVAHSYAAGTARALPQVPLVLDEHNIESTYQAQYFASEGRGEARAERREIARLRAWERRIWSGATAVTCCTATDAETIAAQRGGPAFVVPNGAAIAELPFLPPSARRSREVLFVGLMSHAPNIAAARFLAREVMPLVWREEPSARLILCGRSPTREVIDLAGPSVVVTGTVPSVVPYLSSAAVYANALFQGAGSSLKVPEALASGVPLVSTPVGIRGFPLVAGEHYAPANDAADFARQILHVLRDRATFDARATAGRALAERYDWDMIGKRFARIVTAIARGQAPVESP